MTEYFWTASRFEAALKRSKVFDIQLPRKTQWLPELAKQLLDQVLPSHLGSTLLRIVAEPGKTDFQIMVGPTVATNEEPSEQSIRESNVTEAIRIVFPEAMVAVFDYQHPVEKTFPFERLIFPYMLTRESIFPIKYVTEFKQVDPVAAIVQGMSDGIKPGTRVAYNLYIPAPVSEKTVKELRAQLQRWPVEKLFGNWAELGIRAATGTLMASRFPPEHQEILEERVFRNQLYNVYLLLQIDATNVPDLVAKATNINTTLCSQYISFYNQIDTLMEPPPDAPKIEGEEQARTITALGLIGKWARNADPRWKQARMMLTTSEIAALWHLPHEQFASPAISWAPRGHVIAPAALQQNPEGVIIGDNIIDGRSIAIRLPDANRRAHVNIVGKTEVGKSTLMHNMIHQDIEAGKGVGVIDPHGKLVHDILRESIPKNRINDVVLIDIANESNPPPLNLLSISGVFAAGQTIAILEKLYGEFVQVGDALRAAVLTLQVEQQPTLRDIPRLFSNADYRHDLLRSVDNPAVLDYWQEFEQYSASGQREMASSVLRRIRYFYGNPVLYPMICHPDSLDFAQFITDGKIVLITLQCDGTKVPTAEQRLLGTVLLSQLQIAAMSLKQIAPFQLFIDEVQQFVTTSLDEMFAEVRKYGLYLTVANQYLGQLKGSTLEAVTGNVGATIAFQLGIDDARVMAPYFRPEYEADELLSLNMHEAAVKMRLGTQTLPAFTINTRQREKEPDNAEDWAAQVRKSAIANYTPKTRKQVLDWLEQRYPRPGFSSAKSTDGDDWVVPPEPE